MSDYCAVFSVYRNAGEISDMLSCARKLIEKRCFSGILIAYKRESEDLIFGKRIAASLRMKPSSFSKSRMLAYRLCCVLFFSVGCRCFFHFYFCCVVKPERKLISVKADLDRISHRSVFYDCDLRSGNNTHIKEMLSCCALSAHSGN